ncbi:MAG: FAD:protein FMN transferase [Thermodesulfobacteriota bacterium]|nr:MAG: FAD:protein FMN transferase [Thermodesulfobacteriota bacterium]
MDKKGFWKYSIVALSVFLLLAVSILLIWRKRPEAVNYARPAMGTLVEMTLMEGEKERFDEAVDAAFREIERLEALLSSYRPDSDISRINRNAGKGPLPVSPDTFEVAKEALRVAVLTDGAFDPTVGALAGVWGPSGEKGIVPSKEEVERLLGLVGYRGVMLDENAKSIALAREGMSLNLGGVAKGYIIGNAAEELRARGVARGIVRAGGDMVVFQDNGKPFTIGIKHPRKEGLLGELYIENGAAPTSGDYERFFEKDGVRYHHILDPRTGFPARGAQAVTLAAEDPTTADALATGVFVMGPARGMELIERLEGVEGLIVDEDGVARVSSGFKGRIY